MKWGNNGHGLFLDVAGNGLGGITWENDWFNLMNINLKMQSEHLFNGNHVPLELHFVHKKYDSGHIVVVALPVEIEKTDAVTGKVERSDGSGMSGSARENAVLGDLMTRFTSATENALTMAATARANGFPSTMEFPKVQKLGALTSFMNTFNVSS